MPAESRVSVFSSDNRINIPVYPQDLFLVTPRGKAELDGADTRLPPDALEVLVLLDGKATVGDVEQKARHLAPEALRETIRALLAAGLVRGATIEESEGLDFSAFFAAAADAAPSAGAVASARLEATTGSLKLGDKGYYVSIARHAVAPRALAPGARAQVLLVEDDDIAQLVTRSLAEQSCEVQSVGSRSAVLARLRQTPLPDLVLLDVTLPDLNGFELLQRMKTHPALKAVPVIMLTAEATRESVVRGLVAGADGYITKPFKRESLVRGVRAVLGV